MLRHLRILLVAGALFAVAPAAAQAATGSSQVLPNQQISQSTSTNWSGYALTGAAPYTSISSNWVQPTADCSATPNSYSSFWVGLDGYNTNSVEQTGTSADCSGSTPNYYGWYEMYPKLPVNYSNPVVPGDSISASVVYLGSNQYKLTLSDTTQGWTQTTTQTSTVATRGSAEVIAEAPSSITGVLPLADFGTVNFSGTKLSPNSIAGANPITMETSGGTVKAKPSAANKSTGSFSVTWYHK